MRRLPAAVVTALVISVPTSSWAQSGQAATFSREVSISLAVGHVFRYEDQTYGDRPNIGGGVAIVHRSGFGVEFEVDRTLGLSPKPASCGVEGATCLGIGHNGVRSATIASFNAQYRFTARRFQPYLIAGLGTLWSKSVWSTRLIRGSQVIVTEEERSDRGFGPDLGAGLRLSLSRAISINPEIRWLDAPWLSGANLAVTRVAVRAAYSW